MGNTIGLTSSDPSSPSKLDESAYSTLDESTYSTYTSASEDVHLIFQSLRKDSIELPLPSNRQINDIKGNILSVRSDKYGQRLLKVLNIPSYSDKGIITYNIIIIIYHYHQLSLLYIIIIIKVKYQILQYSLFMVQWQHINNIMV